MACSNAASSAVLASYSFANVSFRSRHKAIEEDGTHLLSRAARQMGHFNEDMLDILPLFVSSVLQ